MNPPRRNLINLFILFLLACDATFSMGYPTATIAPPTQSPTATPPGLDLTLVSAPYSENNQSPPYTITAVVPQLTGSDDPRVLAFNETTNLLMASEIETFKNGLVGMASPPLIAVSTFDATFTVVYQGGDLWSIRFDITIYADGAAHPGELVRTLNYDFAHMHTLALDELFLPDSEYLQFLSDYCSKELAARDIAFFDGISIGAEPTPENYRNWVITPQGLVILFERGQVAAFAAPAQEVLIPIERLQEILHPQGILAGWVK